MASLRRLMAVRRNDRQRRARRATPAESAAGGHPRRRRRRRFQAPREPCPPDRSAGREAAAPRRSRRFGLHLHQIVEARRQAVVGGDFPDGEDNAGLDRDAAMREAEGAHHLSAPALGEFQEIGVVDDAARVGVLVIDAQRHRVREAGKRRRAHRAAPRTSNRQPDRSMGLARRSPSSRRRTAWASLRSAHPTNRPLFTAGHQPRPLRPADRAVPAGSAAAADPDGDRRSRSACGRAACAA